MVIFSKDNRNLVDQDNGPYRSNFVNKPLAILITVDYFSFSSWQSNRALMCESTLMTRFTVFSFVDFSYMVQGSSVLG